jgi:hypothetical protein
MIGWHRRFALIGAIAVLIWGCSGLLHPLMSWTNPRAVSFMPPAVERFEIKRDVLALLKQQDIAQVEELRVIGNQLQVKLPGQAERVYINLDNGHIIKDADRDHAVMVARHYTGLKDTTILSTELITQFSNRYTYINRFLPVWKVSFDDPRHISVYVDTETDRLGSITDTRKVILQTLFQTLHTGQWLEGVEPLRLALIALLVGSALSVAIAGIYMLVCMRGSRKGPRKIHRVLAYAALFPLLMFPVSGIFHLFVQSPLLYGDHDAAPVVVDVSSLHYFPKTKGDDLRMTATGEKVWWRVQAKDDVSYMDARGKAMLTGDEAFVREMVNVPVNSVTKVTNFSDEYGFAYKRLPVWRVDMGHELLFVEAKTGVIAAHVEPLKVVETWSFSRLHKWQFLDGLSEKVSNILWGPGPFKTAFRDAVMVAFMLMGIGMAVLGLMIRQKRV